MTTYLSNKIKEVSFFAIIMVVLLHSYNLDTKQDGLILVFDKGWNWFIQTFFSYGITRIAVPLFFVVSGFLFFKGAEKAAPDFKQKIRKRFATLVIPYFFWVLFGILFYYAMQSIPQTQQFFTKKLIIDYSASDWLNAIFVDIIPYQLWFLRDLIVLTFVSSLIFILVKKAKYLFLLLLLFFWSFSFDFVLFTSESLLFFSFGTFVALHQPQLPNKIYPKKYAVFVLIWLLLVFLKVFFEKQWSDQNMWVIGLLKTSILIGIFAFWMAYDVLKSSFSKINFPFKKWIAYSFFIYVFHEPLLTISKKALFRFLGKEEKMYLLIYCISPVITIAICVFAGYVLKKYAAGFYKIITGNR